MPTATPLPGDRFREVLGGVPAPVAVVTTLLGGRPHGTTVSAFCSVSLDPPFVLVSLDRTSRLLAIVRRSQRFAINVLAQGQDGLARHFARKADDKFEGVAWETANGLPRLPGIQSWIACELDHLSDGGDHELAIGLVVGADRRGVEPLVYRERTFWALDSGRR